jgi:DNA-binding CsgD family transcriptional regulator
MAPGAPHNLVLHGDPGVGKTVLLQAGICYARERGIRVLELTGYESEACLAHAGLHALLGPIMAYLDRIEPFHRDVLRRTLRMDDGPAPDRLALSAATFAVLAAVASDGPLLISVEDCHWIDHPSRELMMFVILRLEPFDIRAIFARRSLTATERVTPGVNMLEVGPLTEAASVQLLRMLHPNLPPAMQRQVLQDAAGNPLAIAELPTALGTKAAIGLEMLPASASVRTRLEATYASRTSSLPAGTRAALLLTALDGDRLERQAVAGQPSALSPQEITEVERLGLVTRDSTWSRLTFRHPLVRSAIVNSASPEQVRAAHAELAASYRLQPERRLWHLAAATIEPDEDVAAEIEHGAEQVSGRGGCGLSVAALRRAAALTPTPKDAARRLQRAAELATESGQLDAAQELLEQARKHEIDPAQVCRGQLTAARLLLLRDGDLTGAWRLLMHAFGRQAGGVPAAVRDDVVQTLINIACLSADRDRWAVVGDIVAACGGTLAEEVRLSYDVRSNLGRAGASATGRLQAAFERLTDDAPAMQIAELCRMAMRLDVLPDYRPYVRRLIDREVGSGAVFHAATSYEFAARDFYLSGDWDNCEKACNDGLDLSIRHGLSISIQGFRSVLGLLAAGRGDIDTVREFSRLVEGWADPRDCGYHLALSARNQALAAISKGDYEAALHYLTRIGTPGSIAPYAGYALSAIFDLVEAAVRVGRVEDARAHVEAAARAGVGALTPRLRLLYAGARALAAPDSDAGELFRKALAPPQVKQWPFDHARVRLAFGELHRRNHRPGDARPELQRAADIFARIGATAWQRRAEQELRATGIAVSPVRALPPDLRIAGLTSQQLEVAKLAASGLRNKEIAKRLFLSPRTVSAHLYRAFPKLGISSRSALRDALDALTDEMDQG